MTESIKPELKGSPQTYARIGGLLYLIIILGGIFGEMFIRNRIIVSGDAAATARNIQSSELLWRIGAANEYFMLICAVFLALILYVLLRPVSKDLALLALFFNLICIAMEASNELHLMKALFPLENGEYLKVLAPAQLQAMSYLSLKSYGYGFGADLIFFAFGCLVLGYLIFKSGYLPRTVGVLMQIAGLCYLINNFALIVSPPLADRLFPAIMLPVVIGEGSLCLWLLVKGVNLSKWNARAGRPALSTVAGS